MHQNFQDQLIPSYFIYWVQKPCWIKGRSEFRSTINVFWKKALWDAARSCVSITNQPILRTLEATHSHISLCSSPKSKHTKKKQPVTSNSIPDTEKSSDTRWCISTCMSWKLIGPTLGRPPASATKCFGLVETFGHLTCPTGLMKVVPPNVGGSQRIPLSLPSTQKKLNIDTKSEALQIFMEIFLVWESWKNFIVIDLGGLPGIFPWESCYYFLKPWIDSEAYIIYKNLLCLHSFRSESQFKASLRKGYIPNSAYHTSCGKPWPNSSSTDPVVPPGKKPKQAQRRCRSLPARVGAESCHSWKSQLLVATF